MIRAPTSREVAAIPLSGLEPSLWWFLRKATYGNREVSAAWSSFTADALLGCRGIIENIDGSTCVERARASSRSQTSVATWYANCLQLGRANPEISVTRRVSAYALTSHPHCLSREDSQRGHRIVRWRVPSPPSST